MWQTTVLAAFAHAAVRENATGAAAFRCTLRTTAGLSTVGARHNFPSRFRPSTSRSLPSLSLSAATARLPALPSRGNAQAQPQRRCGRYHKVRTVALHFCIFSPKRSFMRLVSSCCSPGITACFANDFLRRLNFTPQIDLFWIYGWIYLN